jgi:CelD/BcsL family acetyltransferase involved in cellulose biosynthesis
VTKASGFQGVMSALYAGDELLAAHLGMASERVLHFWLPAYNRAYGRFSPGSILLLELARAAAATGWTRIDLGKGPEHYKSRFRSGAFSVAEGSVDPRPLHRVVRRAWTQGRQRIRSSRLAGPVGIAKRLVRRALKHRPPA